jgi:hypothetical protein
MSPLAGWESFYVVIGSSAAALTGLQFVVMTLVAEMRQPSTPETIDAFGTPTIVHFCMALLLSAILSAPWQILWHVGLVIAATGLAGLVYACIIVRRARRQTGYRPVFEDWLWHAVLPVVAYAMLLAAGAVLGRNETPALFIVGAVSLLLVFIGIHNAWDTVTYVTATRDRPPIEGAATAGDLLNQTDGASSPARAE